MKARKIILTLILLICISGCWDARNLEQLYYVHTVGVDYHEGDFEIYIQVANFQAMAGGGEGGADFSAPQAYVSHAKGKTTIEAIHQIYRQAEREISWGHLSAIVFTERALKEPRAIIGVLETFGRYYESRNTMWIMATTSPLVDVLTTFPRVEFSVTFSSFGEPTQSYQQSSFVAPIRLHHFLAQMNEPGQTNVFPVLNIVNKGWFEEGSKSKRNIHFKGAALLEGLSFKGFLLADDMLGIRWSQKKTVRAPVKFDKDENPIGTVTIIKPKMKVSPQITDEGINFRIKVKASGYVGELYQAVTIEEIEKSVAQHIEQDLRNTFAKGLKLDADPLQLSHSLYKHDPHLWHKRAPEGKLPLSKDSIADIEVEVKIKQSGRDKFRSLREYKTPLNYWNEKSEFHY